MNRDFPINDPLWHLLSKASSPALNPFFARNVLRRIRQAESAPFLPMSLLRWIRGAAVACLAVAFISTLVSSRDSLSPTDQTVFDNAANIDAFGDRKEMTLLGLVKESQEPFLIY